MNMKFRKLVASEVEVRIGNVGKTGNGVSLLLYKDARVDQKLLDEVVGPMNWQKGYRRDEKGRLFCAVSVWDDEKKAWVSKEDVGIESYAESEKGEVSDAFKRSCFCWGIGRELYSAPFLWVSNSDCNISPKGNGYTCNDSFECTALEYDNAGNIVYVEILNRKTKKTLKFGTKPKAKTRTKKAEASSKTTEVPEETEAPKTSEAPEEEGNLDLSNDEDPASHKLVYNCSRTGMTLQEIFDKEGDKFLRGILTYARPDMEEDIPFVKKFLGVA